MDVTFKAPTDFTSRVHLIVEVTQSICESVGKPPSEGISVLLTAALYIATSCSEMPLDGIKQAFIATLLAAHDDEDASHVRH